MKNKNRGLFQNIQLSIVIMVFGIVIYSSIHLISFGISSTISDNLTQNDVINLTNKGASLNQIGKFNDSIALFNKALSIDSNYVFALYDKGNALDNLGNHTGAKAYYTKALITDPRYIPELTNKANFLVKIGNYQLTLIYYDKALSIEPQNAEAIEGKKQALTALNQSR
ncbi:MAG: tetratricopeptide repeat protein [Candidatus Nitrosocosmicus sp.]